MRKILILNVLILVTTIVERSTCDRSAQDELTMQRRSFSMFLDEEKLRSYLLSFGGNPSAEESRQHMIYKRASQGRVRKLKKVTTAAPLTSSDDDRFPEHKISSKAKNVTITPRMIKFEVEDAKYSEEYEQLKKSRKIRIKRAATDNYGAKNGTRMEKFLTPDTFMQPKEFLKFLISDAITSSAVTRDTHKKTEEKKTAKRDVAAASQGVADSASSETFKKVKISHPLSAASRTKHVSFEELPAKLQKTIESALNDAVSRGKANDGDYLKVYYGDKVVKIPVSMSKQILHKSKETTTAKSIVESYVHKTVEFPKKEEETSYKGTFFSEAPYKHEPKYETKYYYPTTTEKAESYVNFVTPKDQSPHVEEVHYPPKKSIYFFTSEEEATPTFESLKKSSPKPIVFESSTPSSVTFSDLSKNYESHVIHPTSSPSLGAYKTYIKETSSRDTIPITEEIIDDSFYSPYQPLKTVHEIQHLDVQEPIAIPLKSIQHLDVHKTIAIPPAKSYIGFQGSMEKDEHIEKNYDFGYHISDYKTGNSFGHQQSKKKDEITGQYSILLPDGRIQTTKYFADDSGFHADVSYSTIHH